MVSECVPNRVRRLVRGFVPGFWAPKAVPEGCPGGGFVPNFWAGGLSGLVPPILCPQSCRGIVRGFVRGVVRGFSPFAAPPLSTQHWIYPRFCNCFDYPFLQDSLCMFLPMFLYTLQPFTFAVYSAPLGFQPYIDRSQGLQDPARADDSARRVHIGTGQW